MNAYRFFFFAGFAFWPGSWSTGMGAVSGPTRRTTVSRSANEIVRNDAGFATPVSGLMAISGELATWKLNTGSVPPFCPGSLEILTGMNP